MCLLRHEDDVAHQRGYGNNNDVHSGEDGDPWAEFEEDISEDERVEEPPEEEDEENQPPRKRIRVERPQDYYDIVDVNEKFVKKYQATTYDYRVQFRNMDHLSLREFLPRLGSIFESILERLTDGLPAEDRVRLVFQSTYLNFPIALPFLRVDELTVERFLARIEQVLQCYSIGR